MLRPLGDVIEKASANAAAAAAVKTNGSGT
jgi:hypothetical protein